MISPDKPNSSGSGEASGSSDGANVDAENSDGSTTAESAKNNFDPQHFLKTVTQRPGVYQMLNLQGDTIYVGKAGNLKKRVSS